MASLAPAPRLLLILLAGLALGIVGCGGDDNVDARYREGLGRLQHDFAEANAASRAAAAAADPAERAEQLTAAHDALASAAQTAHEMEPPKRVASTHRSLERALSDYADVFAKLASLKAGDPNETELYSSAGEIVAKLDSANRSLKKAGYDVSASAGDA